MDNLIDKHALNKTVKMELTDNDKEAVDLLDTMPECAIDADVTFKEDATSCNDNDGLDPLQENENGTAKSRFQYLFHVDDLLQQQKCLDNHAQTNKQKQTTKRSKRTRLNNEYKSNNGHIWTTEAPDILALPILNIEASVKGPAASASNVLEAWMLLFDEPILREIVHFTNQQIQKQRDSAKQNFQRRPVDLIELRAWLGLNYLCGIFRNSARPGPLDELWTTELGNAIFRATMTYGRFVFIAEHLSLAESKNELAQVGKAWNKFIINCRSYYTPSAWCAVHENVLCPTTSGNGDVKISMLCDAQTLYMANAHIESDDRTNMASLYHLICDIKSTGRHVALSKRYTNIEVSKKLLQRQLTSTGVLAPTAAGAPIDCVEPVLYSDAASLVPHTDGYLYANGLCPQLDAVKVYERCAQSLAAFKDTAFAYDTSLSKPTDLKTTDTLSLQVLQLMLNFAALNAWILLRMSAQGDAQIEQRNYLRQLGLYLTQQHLQRRLLRPTSTTLLHKIQICEILGTPVDALLSEAASKAKKSTGIGVLNMVKAEPPADITLASRHAEKPRRCKPCSQQKRQTKSRTRCQQCLVTRCHNHLIARCFQCTGITAMQAPNAQVEYGKDSDLFQ